MKITSLYKGLWPKMYVVLRNVILPFSKIEQFYPKKGLIYDVGCGFGSYSIALALGSEDREVIGLELSKERVKKANATASKINNVRFEVRDLRKDSGLRDCDCISLVDLLHHVPHETQKEIIQECYRTLKKGGILLIKDIGDRPRWKYLYNYFHDRVIMRNRELFFIKPAKLREMCQEAGFRVVIRRIKHWTPFPHVMFVCSK
ncbi:MAG: class I SAM-dependent methyltransferase [Nanoarchaeota archaeon]|nr:class I SAM-dependent methyltransferase [Nanoarchaeota archaeon]